MWPSSRQLGHLPVIHSSCSGQEGERLEPFNETLTFYRQVTLNLRFADDAAKAGVGQAAVAGRQPVTISSTDPSPIAQASHLGAPRNPAHTATAMPRGRAGTTIPHCFAIRCRAAPMADGAVSNYDTISMSPTATLTNQPFPDGIKNDFSRIMDIQFLHQVGSVAFNGIRTEVEKYRHVFVRFSFSQ